MTVDFARRFLRNRGAVAGLVILALVVLMAATAPMLYPGSPWDMAGPPLRPPGTGKFILNSGAWTLNGSQTSGGTDIKAGTLTIANDGSLGPPGAEPTLLGLLAHDPSPRKADGT